MTTTTSAPASGSREGAASFFQDPPRLGNQWDDDPFLRSLLARHLPADVFAAAEPAWRRMGERAVTDLLALAEEAEANPPRHVPFDPWGRRVDRVEVSAAWSAFKRIAAEEGLVALAYERPWGAWSRLVQHGLLYLFHPSAATYLCPLAMTDGAARLVETSGDADLRDHVLPHLVSRDPDRFWTSGQWMTERSGGSDVGGTETVAVRDGDGWRLSGSKWFTSAVDAEVAFTLARPQGAPDGSRGLALFYVELRDGAGNLQGIRVERLKDKLGTRPLPTAELTLEGTPARLVGAPEGGVRRIATLMNVTRIYNANAAVGGMRRALALARDYARRRWAFGRPLADHPLHLETLADLQTEIAAGLALLVAAVELQGRDEAGLASAEERRRLRLLVPLVKAFTGKQAVAVASEAVEAFGGAGYVEDTGLPRLLRDAQVLSIWEGTTNVLSLDVLRALAREGALEPFVGWGRDRVAGLPLPGGIADLRPVLSEAWQTIAAWPGRAGEHEGGLEAGARRFALAAARTYAGTALLEQAGWASAHQPDVYPLWAEVARRWCEGSLAQPLRSGRIRGTSRHLGLGD